MSTQSWLKRVFILAATPELKFLLPGAPAILVGTALGFAVTGQLHLLPAVLALVSIMMLNAGSNMINDYYDHLSGNDWHNDGQNPFGGGSRYIQNNIVTPNQMRTAGFTLLTLGSLVGLVIVYITHSPFILLLGVLGVLGGYFWTTKPIQICYRFIGEPFIFTLFGLLPVYGAYYIQTRQLDFIPLLPSFIVGTLVALVAMINAVPDRTADAAVNKRTLVVRYGIPATIRVYRTAYLATYAIMAIAVMIFNWMLWAGVIYLLTLPLAILAMKLANETDLTTPGYCKVNKLTLLMHVINGLVLTAGFLVCYYTSQIN